MEKRREAIEKQLEKKAFVTPVLCAAQPHFSTALRANTVRPYNYLRFQPAQIPWEKRRVADIIVVKQAHAKPFKPDAEPAVGRDAVFVEH